MSFQGTSSTFTRLPPLIDQNRTDYSQTRNFHEQRNRQTSFRNTQDESLYSMRNPELFGLNDSVNYMIDHVFDSLTTAVSSRKVDRNNPHMKKIYAELDTWGRQKDNHDLHYKELMKEIDALCRNVTQTKEQKPEGLDVRQQKINSFQRGQQQTQHKRAEPLPLPSTKHQSKLDREVEQFRQMVLKRNPQAFRHAQDAREQPESPESARLSAEALLMRRSVTPTRLAPLLPPPRARTPTALPTSHTRQPFLVQAAASAANAPLPPRRSASAAAVQSPTPGRKAASWQSGEGRPSARGESSTGFFLTGVDEEEEEAPGDAATQQQEQFALQFGSPTRSTSPLRRTHTQSPARTRLSLGLFGAPPAVSPRLLVPLARSSLDFIRRTEPLGDLARQRRRALNAAERAEWVEQARMTLARQARLTAASHGEYSSTSGLRQRQTHWLIAIWAICRFAVVADGLSEDRARRRLRDLLAQAHARQAAAARREDLRHRQGVLYRSWCVLARAVGRYVTSFRARKRVMAARAIADVLSQLYQQNHLVSVIHLYTRKVAVAQKVSHSYLVCTHARQRAALQLWREEEDALLRGRPRRVVSAVLYPATRLAQATPAAQLVTLTSKGMIDLTVFGAPALPSGAQPGILFGGPIGRLPANQEEKKRRTRPGNSGGGKEEGQTHSGQQSSRQRHASLSPATAGPLSTEERPKRKGQLSDEVRLHVIRKEFHAMKVNHIRESETTDDILRFYFFTEFKKSLPFLIQRTYKQVFGRVIEIGQDKDKDTHTPDNSVQTKDVHT